MFDDQIDLKNDLLVHDKTRTLIFILEFPDKLVNCCHIIFGLFFYRFDVKKSGNMDKLDKKDILLQFTLIRQ